MAFKDNLSPTGMLNWRAVGRGLLVAVIGVAVLSLLTSFLFYFSSLSEALLPWASAFVIFLGVALGAAAASRKAGSKGLWHGLAVGIAFFGLTILAAGLFFTEPFTILGISGKLLLIITAGILGGIFGVS